MTEIPAQAYVVSLSNKTVYLSGPPMRCPACQSCHGHSEEALAQTPQLAGRCIYGGPFAVQLVTQEPAGHA